MTTRRSLLPSSLGLVLCLGCAPGTPQVDVAAETQAINDVREREVAAFTAGDVDALVALYTADCVFMPPNEPAATGSDEIRAWAQGMADQFSISGEYTSSEVVISGEWAIERYTAVLGLTPKAGGAATENPVKGIHIYRRQADGSWLIAQDVWNTDSAPAG